MRLLFDTNAVLWRFTGTLGLGTRARQALAAADDVAVSVLAFVEIGIKVRSGKLVVPDNLERLVALDGTRVLDVKPVDGLGLASLPLHHRDPLDRLLILQAQRGDWTILTSDRAFSDYDVSLLDPRR